MISQLRRGVLEFCVLALLREGERYSFDLVRALGDADGLVTSEGTLYPLLGRLRREGLVQSTWRESASGPPRRYYRITRTETPRCGRSRASGRGFATRSTADRAGGDRMSPARCTRSQRIT